MAFDTLTISRKLREAGLAEDVAAAITSAIRESRDFDVASLATRTDVASFVSAVEADLKGFRAELKADLSDLRTTTKSDMAALKADLETIRATVKSDIAALKADLETVRNALKAEISDIKFDILKWVLTAIGFQAVVIVGAVVALTRFAH